MERFLDLIKKAVPILALAVLGYVEEQGADGGFIKDVWTAAKTASPLAAMFAVLAWLDERRERREAQKQCYDRTLDFIATVNEMSRMFEKATVRIFGASKVRRK